MAKYISRNTKLFSMIYIYEINLKELLVFGLQKTYSTLYIPKHQLINSLHLSFKLLSNEILFLLNKSY